MMVLMFTGVFTTAQHQNLRGHRNTMKELNSEQVVTMQSKKNTLTLDLNKSQQLILKSILEEDAKTPKSKTEHYKSRKKEINAVTTYVKYTLRNERLAYQNAHKKKIKALLNIEQYAKWRKMKHKRYSERRLKNERSFKK